MEFALLSLPAWLSALLVIGSGVALSIGFMLATRRFVGQNYAEIHNQVVGFVYAVLGVVYAVLLAFLVIAAWEQLGSAGNAVISEASTLSTLYRQTALLPLPVRQQAQAQLRTYTRDVIDDAFRTMKHGKESPLVNADLLKLYGIADRLTAPTPAQQVREEEYLRLLDQLSSQRTSRVAASREALDPILWLVVFLGAVVTIGYGSLFYLDKRVMQAIIVGSVAIVIVSVLYLLLVVDYPFAGPIHVSADPYRVALDHMHR